MMRTFSQLRADQRGASVIELALVAPIFGALLVGMVDISRAYDMKLRLEHAAQRAMEKVQQTQSANNYTSVSAEATAAATAAGYTGSTVDVSYKLECNGTASSSNTTGNAINATCSTGQTYSRYVAVTITNTYMPMFTLRFFPTSNSDGSVSVSGYAGLRVQ